MADFSIPNLGTAVVGFASTSAFLPQSTNLYTINPSNLFRIPVDTQIIITNETRPGWLTGRRPGLGQVFPRGVYNK